MSWWPWFSKIINGLCRQRTVKYLPFVENIPPRPGAGPIKVKIETDPRKRGSSGAPDVDIIAPDKPIVGEADIWFSNLTEEFAKKPGHVSDKEIDKLVNEYHCKANSDEMVNVTDLKHLGMLRQAKKFCWEQPAKGETITTTQELMKDIDRYIKKTRDVYEWQRRDK